MESSDMHVRQVVQVLSTCNQADQADTQGKLKVCNMSKLHPAPVDLSHVGPWCQRRWMVVSSGQVR